MELFAKEATSATDLTKKNRLSDMIGEHREGLFMGHT